MLKILTAPPEPYGFNSIWEFRLFLNIKNFQPKTLLPLAEICSGLSANFLKLCFDFKSAIKRISIYPIPPYVDKRVDKKI